MKLQAHEIESHLTNEKTVRDVKNVVEIAKIRYYNKKDLTFEAAMQHYIDVLNLTHDTAEAYDAVYDFCRGKVSRYAMMSEEARRQLPSSMR